MTNDEEIKQLLHEIVLWLRFENRQSFKTVLGEVLTNEADRKVYDLSDGKKSQPEIARAAGVSQPTVSLKWKAWRALGIVYEIPGEAGRCRHLASLQSIGLEASTRRKGEVK